MKEDAALNDRLDRIVATLVRLVAR
jgi:hypothetical protein